MRKSLGAGLGAAAVLGAVLVPAAASAATHGSATPSTGPTPAATPAPSSTPTPAGKGSSDPDTTVTFTVTSGALTMSAPGTAKFGSGGPGSSIKGSLGTVSVTDGRALTSASWTATVSSTDFTTGGGSPSETTPAADLFYDPGFISTTGVITVTPSGVSLSASPQTVVAGTNGTGINTASWTPVIVVSVPSTAVTGTYTGTITESVS